MTERKAERSGAGELCLTSRCRRLVQVGSRYCPIHQTCPDCKRRVAHRTAAQTAKCLSSTDVKDGAPGGRSIVCDSCGHEAVENRGMKANDPCPECDGDGLMRSDAPLPMAEFKGRMLAACGCEVVGKDSAGNPLPACGVQGFRYYGGVCKADVRPAGGKP